MSTNIATLADVRAQLAARLQTQRSTLPPATGTKIRVKAKEGFTLPDGTTLEELEAVVVDIRYVNALYKRYVPGQIESPDCWVIAADANDMAPDGRSNKKAADKCDGCPKNEWGSSPNGSGKACKNMVRLAVVSPDANGLSPVYIIDLAPTSTGPFIKLLRDLGNKTIPYQTVVFNFALDPKVDYPKIIPTLLGNASDALAPHLDELITKAQPLISRGFDYDA